jgi:hypothetical protein
VKPETVLEKTGKSIEEWIAAIRDAGLADASHKEIADWLHDTCGISYWWAQSVTVMYEKETGRRVLGQTTDTGFQVGASKTYSVSGGDLWEIAISPGVSGLIMGDSVLMEEKSAGRSVEGIEYEVTTFEPGSHYRARWKLPGWHEHSILQMRVTPKGVSKSVITFHHEKLPGAEEREAMKNRWKSVLAEIAEILNG